MAKDESGDDPTVVAEPTATESAKADFVITRLALMRQAGELVKLHDLRHDDGKLWQVTTANYLGLLRSFGVDVPEEIMSPAEAAVRRREQGTEFLYKVEGSLDDFTEDELALIPPD